MTNPELPGCVAYVAYRRPDASAVDRLVTALQSLLGPLPPGWDSWIFMDRPSLKVGDSWYYRLGEAHRSARRVIGVISAETMPNTDAEFDEHAIYLSELINAQRSGRLLMVQISLEQPLLPIGLDMTQWCLWTGDQQEVIEDLAKIVTNAATPRIDYADTRRSQWSKLCLSRGLVDIKERIDDISPPVILRPIPVSGNEYLRITKSPVRSLVRRQDLVSVCSTSTCRGS